MSKQELRKFWRAKRDSLPDTQEGDAELCRRISELSEFSDCQTVLLYYPVGSETDVLPLMDVALKSGKRVAFPKCDKATHRMTFYYVSSLDELTVGAYGIPEPTAATPYGSERSVCILPALAFDRERNRLGYGGGYYDRFLADYGGVSIAPVREGFLTDSTLPTDEYDQKCDVLVTLEEVLKKDRE